jgi:hypothetical protein
MTTFPRLLGLWTGLCVVFASLLLAPVLFGAWPGYYAAFVIPVWFLYLIGLGILGVWWVISWARHR